MFEPTKEADEWVAQLKVPPEEFSWPCSSLLQMMVKAAHSISMLVMAALIREAPSDKTFKMLRLLRHNVSRSDTR